MKKEYFSVSESVLAGNEGFEPTTHRLTADCSTLEPISRFYSHTTKLTYIHSTPPYASFSLELIIGLEPTTCCLQDNCSTIEPYQHLGAGAGLEPATLWL